MWRRWKRKPAQPQKPAAPAQPVRYYAAANRDDLLDWIARGGHLSREEWEKREREKHQP